jgi:cell division protein ZapA
MAQLNVTIHGKSYSIACADGEENRLRQLCDYLDTRMGKMALSLGNNVSDIRLFLMTSLMLVDELSEAHNRIDKLENAAKDARLAAAAKPASAAAPSNDNIDAMADAIDRIAARLNAIAAKL